MRDAKAPASARVTAASAILDDELVPSMLRKYSEISPLAFSRAVLYLLTDRNRR